MIVLLKKELRSFFSSATGYIVIGIFLLLMGLFLWVFPSEFNVLDYGYAQLDGLFSLAPWLYLFLVPAVTMRMFAEERRTGTIELLYTKPISPLGIVLGKYFAGVILVLLSLLPTLIYFFTIYYLAEPIGNVDSGAFWGSMIGLFFLSAIYVSIGVWASSITSNQITAFLLSMLLCFLIFIGFDFLGAMFSSGLIGSVVENFGIYSHYESMSRGVIDSRDAIYFVSVSVLFVYLTKWKISK